MLELFHLLLLPAGEHLIGNMCPNLREPTHQWPGFNGESMNLNSELHLL
jgi:hypothetical protein